MRSFDQLKEALTNKPVLRAPDFAKDYVIMCDASKLSVSGLVMQRKSDENSQLYVVCYASRKLLPHERIYAVVELEMLANVCCITKCHQYIYLKRVQILSDHRPLEHFELSCEAQFTPGKIQSNTAKL